MGQGKRILFIGLMIILALTSGMVKTFQANSITEGLWGATAYTLKKNEIKLGDFFIPFHISQLKCIYINYGIASNLQVGTAVPANFLGDINIAGKYGFIHSKIDIAIPFGVDLFLNPLSFSLGSGAALSWRITNYLDFHTGMRIWSSSQGDLWVSSLYTILGLDVLSNIKLLSELDLYPPLENPLKARVGGLIRLLDFLNLKITATLSVPSNHNYINANASLRF